MSVENQTGEQAHPQSDEVLKGAALIEASASLFTDNMRFTGSEGDEYEVNVAEFDDSRFVTLTIYIPRNDGAPPKPDLVGTLAVTGEGRNQTLMGHALSEREVSKLIEELAKFSEEENE